MARAPRRPIRARRSALLVGFDIAVWFIALLVSGSAYDAVRPGAVSVPGVAIALGIALGLQSMIAALVGQQHRQAPVGGRDDLVLHAGVTATAGAWMAVAHLLPGTAWLPFVVPVVATVVAVSVALCGRAGWATLRDRLVARRVAGGAARRTLVVGDGYAGRHLVRAMQRDAKARFVPVGFLAEGPGWRGRRHSKVRVLGSQADLAKVLRSTGAQTLVLALPMDRPTHLRELQLVGRSLGVDVLTLPAADELDGARISVHHLRDVDAQLRLLGGPQPPSTPVAPAKLHRMTGL